MPEAKGQKDHFEAPDAFEACPEGSQLSFVEVCGEQLYQEAWEPLGPLMDTVYSATEGRVSWHFCRTSVQFWVLIIAAGETFLLVAGAYPALNRPVLKADSDAPSAFILVCKVRKYQITTSAGPWTKNLSPVLRLRPPPASSSSWLNMDHEMGWDTLSSVNVG